MKNILQKLMQPLIVMGLLTLSFEASAKLRVNKIAPPKKVQSSVAIAGRPSGPSPKVEFKLATGKPISVARLDRKPAQGNDGTYIVDGKEVAEETLDKEKFSKAGIEDITKENFPQIIESFDYPNADILDIAKAISELTGKNFIVDPGVRGKITIIAPTKISVAEAYKAFLSGLAINGFTVVPSGPFLKIKTARNAQRDNIETYSGEYYPNSDQMITRIIHLKHISAEEVNKQLRIIPSKDGEMTPYPPTNSIIFSDYGSNVNRVMKIIKQLDVPGFEEKMDVIPIRFATAKEIAELIEQIINKGQGGKSTSRRGSSRRGSFSSGIPRFSSGGKGGGEIISTAIADDRTNSIIVVGNKRGIERIRKLVARLDFKLRPEDAGGVHVYYVKHGEAEKIEETLSGVATASKQQQQTQQRSSGNSRSGNNSSSPAQTTEPIFGGDVKIVADKATNSLIITASKQDYEVVKALLQKIDIPRDQVYVQAAIMEMNATNANTYDISYFKFNEATNGVGRVGFNSGSLNSILDPTTPGAILGFGQGDTFDLELPGGAGSVTVTSFLSFVNFLVAHTQSNILSTPQIIAMSNEEAEIEVGDKIPVGVNQGTASNGTTTNNIEREDATVKLKFTPFISPDSDLVRMKIEQTARALSQVTVQAAQLADIAVAISDRSINTNIVVRSGDTAVLGGLIRDEITEQESKVPILGDIPILGWLFKSSKKESKKTNLMVFISPTILRDPSDTKKILENKAAERLDYIRDNFNGKDPFGQDMDGFLGVDAAKGETQDLIDETLTE